MTQEEKARAYDEAIKKAAALYKASEPMSGCNVIIETLFPELKESEGESGDEKIRKALIKLFEIENLKRYVLVDGIDIEDVLGWLERQGEHANFLSKIQVGDKVTRNENGVLVNLSQLRRVAKPSEKRSEQKSVEWSEEDEYNYNTILHHLDLRKEKYKKECNQEEQERYQGLYNWLQSLQNRVQPQPKQEWSDVDKDILFRIIDDLKFLRDTISIDPNYAVNFIDMEREITWLKSLKNRVIPQPEQEWSEEDEIGLGDALWAIKQARAIAKDENDMGNIWYAENGSNPSDLRSSGSRVNYSSDVFLMRLNIIIHWAILYRNLKNFWMI